jgi:hypothetical protein
MKTSRVRPAFIVAVSAMPFGCQETPHRNPPALPPVTEPTVAPSASAPPASPSCPAKIEEGQECSSEGQVCDPRNDCGFNGWRCETGKWKKLMKYCNPPPPKQ